MPTMCVVVNCYNRHSKQLNRSFYRFPTDVNRRRKWVAFVSCRNADGSSWQPSDGGRICSDHFVSKEISNVLSNPNYVPSVYPEEKEVSNNTSKGASSVARFERAQHRCKMALKQQRLREEEVESQRLYLNHVQKAFEHDHGSLFKHSKEVSNECTLSQLQVTDEVPSNSLADVYGQESIPVEVGK